VIIDLHYLVNFDIDYFIHCLIEMKMERLLRFAFRLFIFITFGIREGLIDCFGIVKDRFISIEIRLLFNYVISVSE